MDLIQANLDQWKAALVVNLPVGGLFSRNSTVYKWKSPFRCWMLREVSFWRVHDLMAQSYALHQAGHGLGARILLRSAFETLATLIYLNQQMEAVPRNGDFDGFSEKTSLLLLGSKNKSTQIESINIMTVLKKVDVRYPGILDIYGNLSESAHPSYEGFLRGYSISDHAEFETNFSNRWMSLYGDSHTKSMTLCMETYHHEYNDVWPVRMDALEAWIEANDAALGGAREEGDPKD